ncbi:MAG: NADH-quinone oxidoreductase subunit NuoG [bacterium]
MAETTEKKTTGKAAPKAVTLTIDGRQVSVPKGTTVLDAARKLGIYIPTFCWHPKLKAAGSCRMCYVEIEKIPKLMVSCATEATEGMTVFTNSEKVLQGRRAIIEFTLTNHPLDCPTCDQAGECQLQDLTYAHGADDSRFEFTKYRFTDDGSASTFDDISIGPGITHNRNRCILCYRCVRANKEAFGEFDLGAYGRGNTTSINAAPGRQITNPFSGNLAEICPVGALTCVDWRYKMRVWLAGKVPSVCNFYSSGSNLLLYTNNHKNEVCRTTSRCNDDIDDGWLPDVTRYGYQIANSSERLLTPLVKKEGKQVPATWEEALEVVHRRFSEIREKKGGVCIGGLAAPNLDNASLYCFSKFLRTVFNSNNIDFRLDYRMLPERTESLFSGLCRRSFKIADLDDSDVIVVFGSDLLREHPNEYLRLRRARNFGRPRIYSLNPYSVKSADVADGELVYRPGTDEIVISGICLAAIDENIVDSDVAQNLKDKLEVSSLEEAASICGVAESELRLVARALFEGQRVTFMMGELITQSGAREAIAASVVNLDLLLGLSDKGQLAVPARYANSCGAERLGLIPDPPETIKKELTSQWGAFPDCTPHTTDSMLVLMKKEEINGLIVMGADPMMLCPDRQFVKEGLEKLEFLVACDLFENETTALADVVLPLTSWMESAGGYVNLEGRLQRVGAAIRPIGQARPGYDIINMLAEIFGNALFESTDEMTGDIDRLLAIRPDPARPKDFQPVKRPQESVGDDYPLPLFVIDDPHHSGHWSEKSPLLAAFSGEAYVEISADLAAEFELNEGAPVRVESEVGKIIAPARISPWLDSEVVLVPRNFSATPVTSLLMRKRRLDLVKISKVDE